MQEHSTRPAPNRFIPPGNDTHGLTLAQLLSSFSNQSIGDK